MRLLYRPTFPPMPVHKAGKKLVFWKFPFSIGKQTLRVVVTQSYVSKYLPDTDSGLNFFANPAVSLFPRGDILWNSLEWHLPHPLPLRDADRDPPIFSSLYLSTSSLTDITFVLLVSPPAELFER